MRISVMISAMVICIVCIGIKAAKPTARQQIIMTCSNDKTRIVFRDSTMYVFTYQKIDTSYFLELADIGDCNSVFLSNGKNSKKINLR